MTRNEAISKLIAWAESQLGYKAGENQDNKYARLIDSIDGWMNTRKNYHDWCTLFVCAGFDECFNYPTAREMLRQPTSSLGAGCKYAARYYKQDNALFDSPQKGDQIFFGAEGDDHTGIVVDVRQGKVYTIEGNTGDYPGEVARRTYDLSDKWIYAFGRPNWSLVADSPSLAPADYSAHPQKLWDSFVEWLGNEYGAAGLIGNLDAESALIAANLQNSYQYSLDMSDKEYTDKVDSGEYKDFVDDGAGYGLAQWTHWSRKQKLLAKAKECSASIGNEDMQVIFLKTEIAGSFPDVQRTLMNAKSVAEASDCVLLDYERPADQSEANIQRRRDRCQSFYDKYHSDDPKPGRYCEVKALILGIGDRGHAVETLQGALQAHGYDLEYCGGADGIFGEGTEYAVKAYQREHGLTADGVVGEDTWTSLTNN